MSDSPPNLGPMNLPSVRVWGKDGRVMSVLKLQQLYVTQLESNISDASDFRRTAAGFVGLCD